MYPIDRQKEFSEYKQIIEDLKVMQKKLKNTSNALYEIAVS